MAGSEGSCWARRLGRGATLVALICALAPDDAGADDVNALSYNPAGLADATPSVQLDLAVPLHRSRYARSVFGDAPRAEPVSGRGLGLPSPTLGAIHGFGLVDGLNFGLALTADYPMMQVWPMHPTSPQRYGGGDVRGTALTKLVAGAGLRATGWLNVGMSLQVMAGNFAAVNTISTCDGVVCTQPENPAYDAVIQTRATGIVAPGMQLGVQLRPVDGLALGLAWESGYTVDARARLRVRLPSAPPYADASIDPEQPTGRLTMRLPQQLRAGAQWSTADLRFEAAFVYEPWRVHERIGITVDKAKLRNLLALGDYAMPAVDMPRLFQDTWSVRLGGEWQLPWGAARPWTVRGGALYEPSAVPLAMLTPMSLDLDKVFVALGAEYAFGVVRVEATVARAFMLDAHVERGAILQINPTHPPAEQLTPVGNGDYHAAATVVGVGVRVAL